MLKIGLLGLLGICGLSLMTDHLMKWWSHILIMVILCEKCWNWTLDSFFCKGLCVSERHCNLLHAQAKILEVIFDPSLWLFHILYLSINKSYYILYSKYILSIMFICFMHLGPSIFGAYTLTVVISFVWLISIPCSCLENPRDGGAWWATLYGVALSQTRLKWLSSSSSIPCNILFCLFLKSLFSSLFCVMLVLLTQLSFNFIFMECLFPPPHY